MRLPTRNAARSDAAAGTATVRVHRDFRRLLERLEPGDIAVIDRRDLDAAAARLLAERSPVAVLNAVDFVSGRFANLGPSALIDAGVVLLEGDAEQVRGLKDGAVLRLEGDELLDGSRVVVAAHRLTSEEVHERMDQARS